MSTTPRCLRPTRQALALLMTLFAATGTPAQEAPVIRLATNVERSSFPPAEALLRRAYAGLGRQVEFVPWPLTRTLVELNAGRLDGVAMRVDAFFSQTPIVRKIDVPLLQLDIYAFGRPPCPALLPPESLGRHRISYQRGMVATEALVPQAARLPANTPTDAFLYVGMGSADYALMLTVPGTSEVPVQTPQGTLCRVATPLGQAVLYHGVHESHADLVPALEQALRGMRERGEIQQAWAAYEREVTSQNAQLQAQRGRSLKLSPPAASAVAPAPPRR
ncbi:substrate-binding periplasmic protein [Roseateles cellulosilyticus]|uniref:Solute-binding protein family 3/N-terminal domain-containing protein n=1 Tax=Pelomonas cellulosilytica TaxID=2906762 RepID=A0ABS8Y1M8_9BURK|nr:hypothetical protein [Pelomonas sp. P8]MCE4558142.1 hypothetical protein [Pelomonas sp. P8]